MTSFNDMLIFMKNEFKSFWTQVIQKINEHDSALNSHSVGFNHDVTVKKSNTVVNGTNQNNTGAFMVYDKNGKLIGQLVTCTDVSGMSRINFDVTDYSNTSKTITGMSVRETQDSSWPSYVFVQNVLDIQRNTGTDKDPTIRFKNSAAPIPTVDGANQGNYGAVTFYGNKGGEDWRRFGIDCDESVTTVSGKQYRCVRLEFHANSYSSGEDIGETLYGKVRPIMVIGLYTSLEAETAADSFVRLRVWNPQRDKYHDVFSTLDK